MLVSSNPMARGTAAPAFALPDTVSGKTLSLHDTKGEKGTVVMFICNHCPFVIHVNPELVRLARDYQQKGIGFIAISSNDVDYEPQDSPERMKQQARQQGYTFPYLYDETQQVAKNYDAACTPDFYVFDKDLKLAYHGQLDDARPGNDKPLNGNAIRAVLESLIAGAAYMGPEKPSMGCNIKWK